jgi:hypothetical protein
MKDKMADKHSADVHNIEPQARDIIQGKQSQDASALLSAIVDREAREIDAVLLVRLPKKIFDQVFREMRTVNPAVKVVLASGYLDPKIQHSGAWWTARFKGRYR